MPLATVALLLMLLQAQVPDDSTGILRWEALAYVRWFDVSREADVLTQHGAVALRWDKVQDLASGHCSTDAGSPSSRCRPL